MVGSRLTPPSNQDGPFGYDPGEVSNFEVAEQIIDAVLDPDTARKIGREIWDSSTNWLNAGRRARWNDNLRAFQSLHPSGSKYLSRDYSYRSSLYRPKTRAMVRKAEAQTASAFFSNDDVVSIRAEDDDDPRQQASAAIMQALLDYRLTVSVPWFLTLIGARQDGEVMGICAAKATWKFSERFSHTEERPRVDPFTGLHATDEDGELAYDDVEVYEKEEDRPCVDLLAPENLRFEPGADWRNPVQSSPYLVESIPLYISEVRERIAKGEWNDVPDSALRSSTDLPDDVTRRTRETGRVPGKDNDAWKPREFDICWVRENIVRWGGRDWHFFSLGAAGELLTDPRPLEEVYLHGERPYVVGFVVVETHKTYPASKCELVRDLQRAANDDWNLRFDNVKLALNPRQFVRAGSATELSDLRTFMPGKVVVVNTPKGDPIANDVTWDRPPDVTASAYAEQDRINLDFDELVGDFSNSSVQASQIQEQSATGMHLMSGQASGMNEYELRVFSETFVEPLLRLLVKLEQAYETDPVILALAGKNAQLMQKFGINEVTDDLLQNSVTVKVNVGIGATNPDMKLKRFLMAADALQKMFGPSLLMGVNFEEVLKEVMGLSGYKDGERFFRPGFDPAVEMLKQQLAQAQAKQKQPAAAQSDPMRLQTAEIQARSRLQERQMQAGSDERMAQLDLQKVAMSEQAENWRTMLTAQKDIHLAQHQSAERQHMAERNATIAATSQRHPALAGLRH